MSVGKILVVDDDKNICELLEFSLQKEGYTVFSAFDGEQSLKEFAALNPDVVLLDVMLPNIDGWQVCRTIRAGSDVPIIMLTAKGDTFDKVLGLELGADDYIVKPFDTKEVAARIKAILRRAGKHETVASTEPSKIIKYDNLMLDMTKFELKIAGKVVVAPPKELELLYLLSSNPNLVFTRNQLLDKVWGFEYYGDSRTIDVHIKRLREKLKDVSTQWELKTVWSVGYKFELLQSDEK